MKLKLSEIRPCDFCGGQLRGGVFRSLIVGYGAVNPQKANQVLGLTQMFQGHIGLAEMFAPHAEEVITITDREEFPELSTLLFVCTECFSRPLEVAIALERMREHDTSSAAQDSAHLRD